MFVKMIFNISILLLLATCKNNNNQINYNQSDRIITQDVNPERICFDLSDSADYSLDFSKALKDKDYRFVGILEFALTVPEVSDYIEKYRLSNGVKKDSLNRSNKYQGTRSGTGSRTQSNGQSVGFSKALGKARGIFLTSEKSYIIEENRNAD